MRWMLACLLLGPSPDVTRLLRDLNADDIAVRDAAAEQVLASDAAILPALKTALPDLGEDARLRLSIAIAEIERRELERAYDAMHLSRHVHDAAGIPDPLDGSAVDGCLIIGFRAYAWKGGTILRTILHPCTWVDVEWSVDALDNSGKTLPVERCGVCGPGRIYIPQAANIRPRVRGVLTRRVPYDITFDDPYDSSLRAVGDMAFSLRDFDRNNDTALLEGHASQPLTERQWRVIQGRRFLNDNTADPKAAPSGWCLCEEGPSHESPEDASARSEWEVLAPEIHGRLRVMVYKPLKAPFEAQGPRLK